MIDTLALVETPEGISLRLRAAGVMPRAAAWALDVAIRLSVLIGLGMLFTLLGEAGGGAYLLGLFCVVWGYPVAFEVLRDGQTPGKQIVGLRVVHANGTPVGWLASVVRNLMRTVDMLPFGYGIGVVAGLVDRRGRRLGDIVAGTLVVHADATRAAIAAPSVPVIDLVQPLSAGERSALVAFAERAPSLTPERQGELASLLPMLTNAHGAIAVQRLLGIAAGILGRR
ncbi:MAG TPA: RDD family protein [Candidatus Saccharimonadia bacterium]|nr:RDD family protein [Candidatus Saccharimonadia bacterium]